MSPQSNQIQSSPVDLGISLGLFSHFTSALRPLGVTVCAGAAVGIQLFPAVSEANKGQELLSPQARPCWDF